MEEMVGRSKVWRIGGGGAGTGNRGWGWEREQKVGRREGDHRVVARRESLGGNRRAGG